MWQNSHRHQKPRDADIPEIFRKPYEESEKKSTAQNAFRKTAIWVPQLSGPDRHVFGINR